jgi:hypothetical protein
MFKTLWTSTAIQYEGQTFDLTTVDELIALVYSPIENVQYAYDGTATGRIEYHGMQKVFCYAKSPTLALSLCDDVKTFLNGKQIGNITIGVGQDGTAEPMDNGYYKALCYFNLSEWA